MNTIEEPPRQQKGEKGYFLPGNTMSKGKPRGARSKATIAMETLIMDKATGIVRKAVEMAINGDPACLKLCMDRLLPARRDRHIAIDTTKMKSVSDAVLVMADLTQSVLDGDITPHEGITAAGIVEVYRKTIETNEINKRLEQLEQIMKDGAIQG